MAPAGSAGVMDLLYALDDRVQSGVLEPGSLAPVARWLGVGHAPMLVQPGQRAVVRAFLAGP